MGDLYRISEKNYKVMLKKFIAGEDINLDQLAKRLFGPVENITEITKELAEWMLDSAGPRKGTKS